MKQLVLIVKTHYKYAECFAGTVLKPCTILGRNSAPKKSTVCLLITKFENVVGVNVKRSVTRIRCKELVVIVTKCCERRGGELILLSSQQHCSARRRYSPETGLSEHAQIFACLQSNQLP